MLHIEGNSEVDQPLTDKPAENIPAETLPGDPDNGPQAA